MATRPMTMTAPTTDSGFRRTHERARAARERRGGSAAAARTLSLAGATIAGASPAPRAAPTRSSRMDTGSARAQPGVEVRVDDVDQEVHEDVDHGDVENEPLDDRQVAVVERAHDQLAHPRQHEDRLDHRAAAEQDAHVDSDARDDRDEGVA